MDATADIKARLSIEELVGQYCQLKKKGRNFVALCPFHSDSHPSLLVSPDKGIAYCFACSTGGDIFSFYQTIEGVDFRQALHDLAERTGVTITEQHVASPKKDEKERLRECLNESLRFYRESLASSQIASHYIEERGVPQEQVEKFQVGYAPDSFSATYEHLLKRGFSRREILESGLGVQKELREERIYDRFRHRLMFPIHDGQGAIVGFGGRTLGEDDAKYINSSEGVLYHKSNILFGLHHAKEKIRALRTAILVEGYFDVLACHRVGVEHVVATSGTALTEQHVKMLKRYADTVALCLDSDRAGQEAAERAFHLLSAEGLNVRSIVLPLKDANELLQKQPDLLKSELLNGGIPYLDRVLLQVKEMSLSDSFVKREALQRLLELLHSLPFAVEKKDYIAKAAEALSTTETALTDDLRAFVNKSVIQPKKVLEEKPQTGPSFTKVEITLALFLFYPSLRSLLNELIAPETGMASAFYKAVKEAPETKIVLLGELELPSEWRERASILMLFCEEHGFSEWSDALALREIRKNCSAANKELLHEKQQEITKKLLGARATKNVTDEALLSNQYQQVLRLMKLSG